MRYTLSSLVLIAAALFAAPAAHGQSLLENGDFENPTDPFKGWVTDYAFTGNSFSFFHSACDPTSALL